MKKPTKIGLIAALMLAVALTACAPATPTTSPADPAAMPLEGTLWVLESYANTSGETVPVLPDTRVTAEFLTGKIGGSAGCNQYFGAYTLDGNALTMNGELGMTQMACLPPVMEQESAYLAALSSVATYQISGERLTISNADGAVVLSYVVDQPVPLVGTNWQLNSYNNSKGGLVSTLNTENITALFGVDGSLSGFGGCNNYNATYEIDGANIKIGPAVTTRMACAEPEGVMEDEAGYLAALGMAATYEIRGDSLDMYDTEGSRVLVYAVAEDMASSERPSAPDLVDAPAIVGSVAIEQRDGGYVAIVQGENSDGCPRIYRSSQTVDGSTISITLTSVKPADAVCAQVLTPFTEEVVIDTSGLTPGNYTVSVNGVSAEVPVII